MNVGMLALGIVFVMAAIAVAQIAFRLHRANPAVYDSNRAITGSFALAAAGRLTPVINSATDYQVKHFAEPVLDASGKPISWRRAGSLSDEAVDGVLGRQA